MIMLNENEWFFSNDHVSLTAFIQFKSGNYNARAPHDWPIEGLVAPFDEHDEGQAAYRARWGHD